MSRKFKSIGLALMVVCAVGAVSAGAAQAAGTPPNWTIAGKTLKEATANSTETVNVTPTGTLALTVPATGLQITCTTLSAPGAEIFGEREDSATSLTFGNCSVTESPGCEVLNKGGVGGTIATPGVKSELKTVGGVVYDIFTPAEPPTFVTIVVRKKTGMSCALSTGEAGSKVSGSVGASFVSNGPAVTLEGQASEAIQKASGASLKFGENPAFLSGKIDFALSGANKGMNWSVDP
jgi:hypothetical protein